MRRSTKLPPPTLGALGPSNSPLSTVYLSKGRSSARLT
jgi:hypothetical protein